MYDVELGTIRIAEPPDDKVRFLKLGLRLQPHQRLGGADIWHLMATMELQESYSPVVLLTFDKKLLKAAEHCGVTTANGGKVDPEALTVALRTNRKLI